MHTFTDIATRSYSHGILMMIGTTTDMQVCTKYNTVKSSNLCKNILFCRRMSKVKATYLRLLPILHGDPWYIW